MQDREFWKLFESTGMPAAYLLYAKNRNLTEPESSREQKKKRSQEPD